MSTEARAKSEFTFGAAFQESMLALMLNDLAFCEKAIKYIPEERLYSEAHSFLFNEIKKKFESTGNAPSYVELEDKLKYVERHRRRIYKSFINTIYDIKPTDPEFIKEHLTEYARKNVFIEIFQDAQTLWNSKKHDDAYQYTMKGINELFGVSFNDDVSIDISEFEEVRQRYLHQALMRARYIPTNIAPLDKTLNGGLEGGKLGIMLAEPKKGKSISLIHMGAACLMMRYGRVAHFLLEGTTEQGVMRYQSRLTHIPYNRIRNDELSKEEEKKLERIEKKYSDRLDLIPMNNRWDYTVLDIEAKLRELERRGRKPNLVIVDYGDLLKSHEKHKEFRHEQTAVFRYLKQLALIHRVPVWTASQAQRPKDDPEKATILRAKDIAECYEKVRIADLIATLNQTPREKTQGIIRFHIDTYRSNECDMTYRLLCDYSRITFHSKRWGHVAKGCVPDWLDRKKRKRK